MGRQMQLCTCQSEAKTEWTNGSQHSESEEQTDGSAVQHRKRIVTTKAARSQVSRDRSDNKNYQKKTK